MEEVLTNEDTVRAGWLLLVAQVEYIYFFQLPRLNVIIFNGPESDHCLLWSLTNSLTDSLTDSRLVNLIDVTLAFEDDNSKLVEVVSVAHVNDEDRVGNSLLQI